MTDAFVEVLEKYLGIVKTDFSLAEEWDRSPPTEADGKSLFEYTAQVERLLVCSIFDTDKFRAALWRCILTGNVHTSNS